MEIGAKLGRYEITREIGRGGMGVVYLAKDTLLEREVALKLVRGVSRVVRERFLREARTIARLDHPAVLPVYDLGEHENNLYFVMPYVEGTTLRRMLDEGQSAFSDVIRACAQVAAAIAHGHEHGVVHRDVKPENVLIERGPSGLRARLGDFGIAFTKTEARLTHSGALVGTPNYMSPEQIEDSAVDGRTDIYSLGVVLYECVTGRPPFVGPVASVLYRIGYEPAPRPSEIGRQVDPELEGLIMGCLAKDPAQRPKDAHELAMRLERFASSLEGSDAVLSTMQASRPRGIGAPTARLVGRERELAILCRALDDTLAGGCQLAFVSGEPGMGKTRLVEELEHIALARSVRVLHGELMEGGQSYPYQGFCELIEQSCRAEPVPDLADLGNELVALFPALADLPTLRATRSDPALRLEGQVQDRTQVFELLSRALARIAAPGPVVLVLSRLHEADVSLEALTYVSRRLSSQPMLFLCSFNDSAVERAHPLHALFESFRGSRRLVHVQLGPLSELQHTLLLSSFLPGGSPSPELAHRLFQLTSGNPYFAVELTRSLLDAGSIVRESNGTWSASAVDSISADALPDTIHKAVEARLSRLSERERQVLSTASVLGTLFEYRELEHMLDDATLDASIDSLVEAGFLKEERHGRVDRFEFPSALLHGVLYGAIPRRTRRRLHQRAAEALESVHRGAKEAIQGQLLLHYVEADDAEKVREQGLILGRKALATFAAEDAITAARRVLSFADEDTDDALLAEGEARLLIAEAHRMKGELDPALRELDGAARAFESARVSARECDAFVLGVKTAYEARRLVDTARWLARAQPVLRRAADPRLIELLLIAATVANLEGDAEAARVAAREIDELRRQNQPDVSESGGTLRIGYPTARLSRLWGHTTYSNVAELNYLACVVETLVGLDRWGNPSPRLAESWESDAEFTRFSFRLREGVRFHDGTELTASRVIDALERSIRSFDNAMALAFRRVAGLADFTSGTTEHLGGLSRSGERRVVFELSAPFPSFPVLLTDIDTGVRGEGSEGSPLIGTGPFRAVGAQSGPLELVRNVDYWAGAPRIDRIELHAFETADGVVEAFENGRLDMAMELPVEHVDRLLEDRRAGARLLEVDRNHIRLIAMNTHRPLGANEAVRRALFASLPIEAMVWRHVGASAQPLLTLIPPGLAGHDAGRRRNRLTLDEAKALLPVDVPRRMRVASSPKIYLRYRALIDAIFEHWRELGFELDIEVCDPEHYGARWYEPNGADVFLCGWQGDYADAATFTQDLFHSRTGELRAYVTSPEVDRLLEQAMREGTAERRAALHRSVDRLLVDSCMALPLLGGLDPCVTRPEVQGLESRAIPPFLAYEQAFFARTESRQKRRGWIVVPLSEKIEHFDPAGAISVQESELLRCCFEGLTRETKGAEVVPWLAESIQSDDGGRVYHVRLRDGLRFHDGRKVMAAHVGRSFEHALAGELRATTVVRFIQGADRVAAGEEKELRGVHVLSANELRIELDRAVPLFPAMLADSSAIVACPALEGVEGGRGIGYVGTGPFRFKSFEPGKRVELEANPYYFRSGHPKCDGIRFSLGVPSEEALQRFESEQATLLIDPSKTEAAGDSGKHLLLEVPMLATTAIFFNTRSGRFQDIRERRAARGAIDAVRLVRDHLSGRALPAHGLLPPGLLGHDPALASHRTQHNDTRVERPIRGGLWSVAHMFPAFCDAVLTDLGSIGFTVEPVRLPPGEFTLDVDFVMGSWIADYPDADSMMRIALHTRDGLLGPFCGHPQIDELLERASTEPDSLLRRTLYQRIEELIAEHCLLVPLYHGTRRWVGLPSLRGLVAGHVGVTGGIDFSELWVER